MNATIEKDLISAAGAENVATNELMSKHTTFHVGGPAKWFVTPASIDAIRATVATCQKHNIPLFVMGRGSNLLVSDVGLQGVVMQLGKKLSKIELRDKGRIHAQAGALNSHVALAALDAQLTGFEFAAGIPGSMGGAAIMNAGAYGGELRNVAISVTCLTANGDVIEIPASETNWSYRHSKMAYDGSIVLSVELQLTPGDPAKIHNRMTELARKRANKQPLDLPSAGSTFKRPLGHFAGKLIEEAGMRGYTVGDAQVSLKHSGFIVNTGNATASDIMQVINDVQAAVFNQCGITLEPEVCCWGF